MDESCPVEVVGLRLVKLNKKIAGETDRRKHDITNSRQNSDTTKHRYNVWKISRAIHYIKVLLYFISTQQVENPNLNVGENHKE